MKNNKYKIYRFDVAANMSKSKDENKLSKLRWNNAEVHTAFKIELFNKFSPDNYETLLSKYGYVPDRIIYEKDWLDVFDIGMDLVEINTGLLRERHWGYTYYKVPLNQLELIKYFDNADMSFNIKIVSKI